MPINFISLPQVPWAVVEEGIHPVSIDEFKEVFVFNPHRRKQFEGLLTAIKVLKDAGCSKLYIDGSYATKKPIPDDYDACWDINNVDPTKLDPVFGDFTDGRASQKSKYEGEFFPAQIAADHAGTPYLDFFQQEKHSGGKKGIIQLDLTDDIGV